MVVVKGEKVERVNVLEELMRLKHCSWIRGVGRRYSESKLVGTEILEIVQLWVIRLPVSSHQRVTDVEKGEQFLELEGYDVG